MKLFETNSAMKTISTMCAAGALLASQAVFAGSDAHSADKSSVQSSNSQASQTNIPQDQAVTSPYGTDSTGASDYGIPRAQEENGELARGTSASTAGTETAINGNENDSSDLTDADLEQETAMSSDSSLNDSQETTEMGADREDRTAGVDAGTYDTESQESNFTDADSNSDSRLDREEFGTANAQQLGDNSWNNDQSFDDYDMNDDDYLDQDEYDSFTAGMQSERENRAASIEADE